MEAKYLFLTIGVAFLLLLTVSNLPYAPPGKASPLDCTSYSPWCTSKNRFQVLEIPLNRTRHHHTHSNDLPHHPLDPLTITEINKVRKIIQSLSFFKNSKYALHSLVLEEPEKEVVLKWKKGDPLPPRKASVVARADGVIHLMIVDLGISHVTEHDTGPFSGYPTMTVEDMTSATWAPFANADFNRTITERGVDMVDVACLPVSSGWFVNRFAKSRTWDQPASATPIPKKMLSGGPTATGSSKSPKPGSFAPVLVPRKEKVRSSSGTANVYGLEALRDEEDDADRPTDILVAEMALRGEGKKRKTGPSPEDLDIPEGVKIKVKAKQIEARGEKRPRQEEPAASVEEVAPLAEKSQVDLLKEMKKLAHHATFLFKEFAHRAKDPLENPDMWRQENEKLKVSLFEAQGQLERYKGQSAENKKLKREVDGLAKDLAAEQVKGEKLLVETEKLRSENGKLRADLEDKASALKAAVEKSEHLECDLDVATVKLDHVAQDIEDAKAEFLKSAFMEDNLTALMNAAISGGYTTAINDCKARDASFDHSGLGSAYLFNAAAENLFEERFEAFVNGVDLNAPLPAQDPVVEAETVEATSEDVTAEASPDINIVDDPISSDLPGSDPLQPQP